MILGVVLAAGRSSRMGTPKALLAHPPSGSSLVERVVQVLHAAGVPRVVVVGRPEDERLAAQVRACAAEYVPNPHADLGQLSSLLTALDAAERDGAQAVLVLPVDMPLVSAATVRTLVEKAASSTEPIVRAVYQGRHGHPVIFKQPLFAELKSADASAGARVVVRRDPGRVLDVEVGDEGVTIDLDTPEDYERAYGRKL